MVTLQRMRGIRLIDDVEVPKDQLRPLLTSIYRAYWSAVYNRKYYGCRLQTCKRANFWIEVIIAIAVSTEVGGWSLWSDATLHRLWVGIGMAAAIVAIVKPLLRLSDQIERYSKLFTSHALIAADFELVVQEITAKQTLTSTQVERFGRLGGEVMKLAPDDDPRPSVRLARKCQQETLHELPPKSFWMPKEK